METETRATGCVLLLVELHKSWLFADGIAKHRHGVGEVVDVHGVVIDHVFIAQL